MLRMHTADIMFEEDCVKLLKILFLSIRQHCIVVCFLRQYFENELLNFWVEADGCVNSSLPAAIENSELHLLTLESDIIYLSEASANTKHIHH